MRYYCLSFSIACQVILTVVAILLPSSGSAETTNDPLILTTPSAEEFLADSALKLDLEESGLSSLRERSRPAAPKTGQPPETAGKSKTSASISSYISLYQQDDFHPLYEGILASWTETSLQTRASILLRPGHIASLGWLDGHIQQENHYFNDTDFNIRRQGPFWGYDLTLPPSVTMNIMLREERFSDRDDSGFYQINEEIKLYTGYLVANYFGEDFWSTVNYVREREPDPVYDLTNNRSSLNIHAKELTGLASGVKVAPQWELGGSIYREQYGSARPNQWNVNGQITHWPAFLPGLRASLGGGYYTEEQELIVNMAIAHQWVLTPSVRVRIEYQAEYSDNEKSLLNEAIILCNWTIWDRLSLDVRTSYGKETGDDRDEEYLVQAAIRILLF